MVYTKKCPRKIAENSNCFMTKYDNVKENPVITRSIIKITHLGTGLEKDRNFFMLIAISLQLIVPNTWIFQEINGMTMRVMCWMAKRNMDITQEIWIRGYLECTEKWIVNCRKFKGLPQQQLLLDLHQDIDQRS